MNWKNKKVFVTGADGFIGSHLVEAMVRLGARVRAMIYYNSFNSWGWLDTFPKNTLKKIDIFTGDIRDPNGVFEAVEGNEIIFHLAALIGIPFSYHSPDSYLDTNIKGTLNILQAAKRNKVEKVIHTSTSEIYGTAQYIPITEDHPHEPQSPYAATKLAADDLALSFYRSFDLPVTILRPFNTFGPRQSARAIIPTIVSQIHSGQEKIKLGNLTATRDFNFITNTIDAFIKIAESEEANGGVYNAGSGEETSVQDLVEIIQEIEKKKVEIIKDPERIRPEKSEVERLVCDSTKISKLCNWKTTVSLKEGLKKTCHWIKKNPGCYKSDIYNI